MVVQRNGYVLVDPEPGELQAIDGYGIDVGIRYRSEDVLHRESRLMFGRLVEAHPETAMLLLHDLDILVAAYLPGAGVHDFVPGTTQDAPDADHWRPWVVA
ncbi:hypothetical protein F1D05_37770 [Kribbella qitaiheensis]|uniref:Uncharacterized protein n=1 Tax=Kribbella qitaiheensis TaxID=1544730 RepID=A0A7G6X8N6_9ACTN|nr:hypothetical protein [Kribbella qitaiheensis]QNE22601.1 hypothetical protein F1D05_37770 [Kribbella qitaiheensis]